MLRIGSAPNVVFTHQLFVVFASKYRRRHCRDTDIEVEDHLVKMNDLEATTKLEWALQMAESIAILHNHHQGVIVHDDVQPFQWLIADDGHIKINDFNRAEVRCKWIFNLLVLGVHFDGLPHAHYFHSLCFMTKNMESIANTKME